MSLATLKKKTGTQYRNMSVNRIGGFSLNGTRRSQGYIGQSMVSRHFPSTPMRGNVPRGHGGCCGTYKVGTIIQTPSIPFPTNPSNGSTASNKTNVIKSSVLDTNGMIMKKYRWIRRPQPYATVKPDGNMIQGTQNSYIENLAKKTVTTLNACNTVGTCRTFANTCGNLQRYQRPRPFGTTILVPRGWYSTTKTSESLSKLGPIDQSSFIKALGGSCTTDNVLPRSSGCHAPLPGPGASY
jgi:hypothetical protein